MTAFAEPPAGSVAPAGAISFPRSSPDTDAPAALAVAQRLRTALDSTLQLAPGAQPVRYAVSIGVAMLEPGESIESLLARADAALYQAKAGGRNLVVAATGRPPVQRAVAAAT